jgi:hypothetical protein
MARLLALPSDVAPLPSGERPLNFPLQGARPQKEKLLQKYDRLFARGCAIYLQ